jgi:hypothetical protein
MDLVVTERGHRDSCLGRVLQLKICAPGYRPLSWDEVHAAFVKAYPGQWAVQVFPPTDKVLNGKAVYHLWALEPGIVPEGLNLR